MYFKVLNSMVDHVNNIYTYNHVKNIYTYNEGSETVYQEALFIKT